MYVASLVDRAKKCPGQLCPQIIVSKASFQLKSMATLSIYISRTVEFSSNKSHQLVCNNNNNNYNNNNYIYITLCVCKW